MVPSDRRTGATARLAARCERLARSARRSRGGGYQIRDWAGLTELPAGEPRASGGWPATSADRGLGAADGARGGGIRFLGSRGGGAAAEPL